MSLSIRRIAKWSRRFPGCAGVVHLFTGFLGMVVGDSSTERKPEVYDGRCQEDPDCYVCGPDGVLGAGDARNLPFRRNACSA